MFVQYVVIDRREISDLFLDLFFDFWLDFLLTYRFLSAFQQSLGHYERADTHQQAETHEIYRLG